MHNGVGLVRSRYNDRERECVTEYCWWKIRMRAVVSALRMVFMATHDVCVVVVVVCPVSAGTVWHS